MPKTKISEFSATPANNTDIDSINIAEGCAPSGINDAIRELMAQLKDFQTGAVGDSFNGPVGTTTAAAGAFTTLSASSTATLNTLVSSGATLTGGSINGMAIGGTTAAAGAFTTLAASGAVTLSGGTANGVAYLNGSKVVTSGSALTFDGTTLGNSSSGTPLSLNRTGAGSALIELKQSGTVGSYIGTSGSSDVIFFNGSASELMRLNGTGLGIGTSSPAYKLSVNSGATTTIGLFTSTGSAAYLGLANSGATTYIGNDSTSGSFIIQTPSGSFSTKLTLDNTGNLGLGVTPSAWASVKAIQYINGAAWGIGTTDSGLSHNAYFSAGWKYISSSAASTLYAMSSGAHAWSVAPSGTAGNAITFTQAMTLDASGNWQLGTTTASNPNGFGRHANIRGSSNAVLYIGNTGAEANCMELGWTATESYVGNVTSVPLTFLTNNTERARIDSSGNLLVGTTTAAQKLTVNGAIAATINSGTPNTNYATFGLYTGGAIPTTYIQMPSGGAIDFWKTDTATAVRIDSSGNLLMAKTANDDTTAGFRYNAANKYLSLVRDENPALVVNRLTSDGNVQEFWRSGTLVGSVSVTTVLTTYNTTSDYRLKNVIGAVSNSGERLDALEPIEYEWKTDGSRTRGFLAHKFQEVYAGSVTGTKDAVDADGKPIYQAMQASSSEVIADLVAEIQSLRKRLADAGI